MSCVDGMASHPSNGDSAVSTFMEITDSSDRDAAELYLQMADGHVDRAVSMWMEYSSSQERYPHAKETLEPIIYEETARVPDEIYSQKLLSDDGNRTQLQRSKKANTFAVNSQNKELERPQRGLSALFAPPIEMNCEESFEKAQELASNTQRWLLVNIQKNDYFHCHLLNRDIWSNESVREVLKSHFVFWQREAGQDDEADLFCKLYDVTTFPYVAVIDPRTGSEMKKWALKLFLDPLSAASELIEFTEVPYKQMLPNSVTSSGNNSSRVSNIRNQTLNHVEAQNCESTQVKGATFQTEQLSLSNAKQGLHPYEVVNAELAELHRLRGSRTKGSLE